MAQANKVLIWPPDLKPSNELSITPMTGVTRAKYMTGAGVARTFYDRPLMKISAKFFLSPLLDDVYDAHIAWLNHIQSGDVPFLFMNPHPEVWMNEILGITDGTQKAWVVPFTGMTSGVTAYLDGALTATPSVYYDGPNLVEDHADSLCSRYNKVNITSDTGVSLGTGASYISPLSAYGEQALLVSVGAGYSGNGIYIDFSTDISVALNKGLNVFFEAYGDASFKAGIDATFGTPVTLTNTTRNVVTHSITPGASNTYSTFRFACNTTSLCSASSSIFAITRGDIDVWYPSNVRMPVIEFASAPTSGQIISAQYGGTSGYTARNRMLRCFATSVSHAIEPDGNRFATVVMEEVPV